MRPTLRRNLVNIAYLQCFSFLAQRLLKGIPQEAKQMRNAEAIRKQETSTLGVTKHIAKILTAIVMLLATAVVLYIAS